jgi:hypothetical protein
MEKVYKAWRRKKVASLLMLDVSGAFDNVSHERLLHSLRKQGLPLQLPYLKQLIHGYNAREVRARRIHLVWQVRNIGKS